MYQIVEPKETSRAAAFELWRNSPTPMVTFLKTLDVSRLVRMSRRKGLKFNKLLCYCIGQAATGIDEMFQLPVGDVFHRFDGLCIDVIVNVNKGGIQYCDIPFTDDFQKFSADYDRLTREVAETGIYNDMCDSLMCIGTSALVKYDIDAVINAHSGYWNNPFIAWGSYRKGLFRTTLPVSMQFHHAQMDGQQAALYLDRLQETIKTLKI